MKNMKQKQKKSQKQIEISKETIERCEIAKKYIEKKYQRHFEEEKLKKKFYEELISQMHKLALNEKE